MEINENKIPLYPYNGRSLNLIDKFYTFGYNYLALKKFILEGNPDVSPDKLNKEGIGVFKIEEEPSTLTEITNDLNKQLVEAKAIKKCIFPNSLFACYRIEKDNYDNYYRNSDGHLNELEINNFTKIDLSEDKTDCPVSSILFSLLLQ